MEANVKRLQYVLRATIAMTFIAGIVLGGKGMWIYGKAKLAQLLLQMSWRSALAGKPVKPWPWADTRALAKMEIDGDNMIVLSGASGRTMAFGPGHLDGSALPGESGNCVITAHRDTHFSRLRYVVPGDTIRVQRADRQVIEYEVNATRIVAKDDVSVIAPDARTRLTLITCYPFDSVIPGGPLRYVIVATASRGTAPDSASRFAGTLPTAHRNTEWRAASPARGRLPHSRFQRNSRVPLA